MYRKYNFLLYIIPDILLKISLGLIFFNYGYVKLVSLINGKADNLIDMVSIVPIFGFLPVFFSWILALSETFLIFALLYGVLNFLPMSLLITKLAGIYSLIISIIIVYMHIFIWNDNVFAYGPFDSLNIVEGKSIQCKPWNTKRLLAIW